MCKTKLKENSNFCLFAEKGNCKWKTSVCFLQTETESRSLFFLGRQSINGKWRLLYQQTCPSILKPYCGIAKTTTIQIVYFVLHVYK